MKVQLAKVRRLKPRLLLSDEPTNHLDFKSHQWLEDRLGEYPHTCGVVPHDANFLHKVCHAVLWMKDQKFEALPRI